LVKNTNNGTSTTGRNNGRTLATKELRAKNTKQQWGKCPGELLVKNTNNGTPTAGSRTVGNTNNGGGGDCWQCI
jgi:hypothetical protein